MCESLGKNKRERLKCICFFVCAYNYQDFAQTQDNFALSHETVTFRNFAPAFGFGELKFKRQAYFAIFFGYFSYFSVHQFLTILF